jgi:signal transduction histidine kinase
MLTPSEGVETHLVRERLRQWQRPLSAESQRPRQGLLLAGSVNFATAPVSCRSRQMLTTPRTAIGNRWNLSSRPTWDVVHSAPLRSFVVAAALITLIFSRNNRPSRELCNILGMRLSMKRVKDAARVLGMIAALCIVAVPTYAAEEEARVLILNGLDPYLPAYLAIDSAMRADLAKETKRRIVLYSELLDAQRFAIEPREPELVALLAKKYSALHIDVVVTVTEPALDFYKQHGEQLWPGARLVFHGLPDGTDLTTLPPHAIGQVNRDDLGATIILARRLQPNARRILVISGVSPLDLEYERRARQVVPAAAGAAAVEFLSGLPLPELVARVAAEPADTIVYYLTQFRDRDGRPYLPREVLHAISSASAAPVYGPFETYIGFGIVAGDTEFYEDRGRLVGGLVRDVLDGRLPSPDKAVFSVPSRCVADLRALQRWSLDEGRLPFGCDIRFADPPLWRRYWWQILVTLAVIAGQATLIMALLAQRRRRRAAEVESRKRFAEMAHMNRRVSMGELSASIAHELNQPLGAIHNNAGAAEMLIKVDPPKLQEVAEILADIKRDDQRASDVIARVRRMMRKTEFEVQDIDLNETIGEAIQIVTADATVKGVSLKVELEPRLAKVRADRVEVQQVILNLALNAIEAMHDQHAEGRRLVVRSKRANGKEAEVSVADSGPGIPGEMLPRIFEPFVTSKSTGMGLGLAISRTIVEAHGGQIRAENSPAGGAVLLFMLPFA